MHIAKVSNVLRHARLSVEDIQRLWLIESLSVDESYTGE